MFRARKSRSASGSGRGRRLGIRLEWLETRRMFAARLAVADSFSGVESPETELAAEPQTETLAKTAQRSNELQFQEPEVWTLADPLETGIVSPTEYYGMNANASDTIVSNGNPGWITMDDGIVEVHGTNSADTVTVSYIGALVHPSLPIRQYVHVTLSNQYGSQARFYYWTHVDSIEFYAHGGDDTFSNSTYVPSLVEGGEGDDNLTGGWGDDDIRGRGGDDTILGGSGDDKLYGGDDDDTVRGGSGDDVVAGVDGSDHVYGDAGDDTVSGGTGNDNVYGGSDDDLVSGDGDNDTVRGNGGLDELLGGPGADTLHGGSGNDELFGHDGNDVLHGNGNNDTLDGGEGSDTLNGNDGHDHLDGGSGTFADTLNGGGGNDQLDGGAGVDTLHGGLGIDSSPFAQAGEVFDSVEIQYGGGSQMVSFDLDDGTLSVSGDGGNDVILVQRTGNSIDVYVNGNSPVYVVDADTVIDIVIDGLGGNDELTNDTSKPSTINGGSGDDLIRGGSGPDDLFGNSGRDKVYGLDGNDYVDGGSNHDAVFGGYGMDTLVGGGGADRFLSIEAGDVQPDFSDSDAFIWFRNDDANWSYEEIEQVDSALEALVERTNNTDLLRTHTGHSMEFHRQISHPVFAGLNSGPAEDKKIFFYDNSFDASGQWTRQVVFHEIAHNWDDPSENSIVDEFRAISGWTTDPDWSDNNPWDPDAPWMVPVDDGWWRDFHKEPPARAYGGTSPWEDFATAFAAVMMDFIGEDYLGGAGETEIGVSIIPQKAELLNEWLDDV